MYTFLKMPYHLSMKIGTLGILFFMLVLNAFSANLSPWKVTVLNGFPDVAKNINAQTKEALLYLQTSRATGKIIIEIGL